MKQILSVILLASFFSASSQILFEKGYFINNQNQKTACLIKNVDWKNNPSQFSYKLQPEDDEKIARLNTIKEFGIFGISKYKRVTVDIDRSSEQLDKLSDKREGDFKKETLFLKVLIEGKASLYYYEDGNLRRFFYQKNNTQITQLVYKSYLVGDKVYKNSAYKQQLYTEFSCKQITKKELERMQYFKSNLERFFIKYNECKDVNFVHYKRKRDVIHLSARIGVNSSSAFLDDENPFFDVINYEDKLTVRTGVEMEWILPFNNGKWAFIIEPTYRAYGAERTAEPTTQFIAPRPSEVKYKSLELPFGIRHYIFLNKKAKIFVNASVVFDAFADSELLYGNLQPFEINSEINMAFGAGFKFAEKYSAEFRVHTKKELTVVNTTALRSGYENLSLIFGYTLF